MEDRKKAHWNLRDQYFGKWKTGIRRTILNGWKMQDQQMEDHFVRLKTSGPENSGWILKDYFAGAMTLYQ